MAFDETLASRVRARLAATETTVERRMFGGLAFLVGGNMAVGVHGAELIVRMPPTEAATALAEPGVRVFDLTGRPMQGWLLIAGAALESDTALANWVDRGVTYARSLPAK